MLIRKASIAALIAALSFATTPGFACTGISLKAKTAPQFAAARSNSASPCSPR